ncbi:MAG: FAD:protein FMN transferase [Clostridiales bacterium]|nr:FAD:protein FMN transferase [Clostridiales bacterium]
MDRQTGITTFALGTLINIKAFGANTEEALSVAVTRLNNLDNMLSVFKKDSCISQINTYAGDSFVPVSPETFELLHTAVGYCKKTNGAFDPTIKPIVDLWGIGRGVGAVPSKADIREAARLVDYRDILFDRRNWAVKLRKSGQSVDLGGIAKGYAADSIREIFIEAGITSALIDLGGNILMLGDRPDGKPWRTGIQDPFSERGKYIGVIEKSNFSVVTSGGYEKFSTIDGRTYHHILDPRTGCPSESDIISATVVSENSIDGDGLSTGLFILGLKKAVRLVESLSGIEAVFITKDRQVVCTSGIKGAFSLAAESFRLTA